MEKSEYDAILRHLNDPDSIDDEYRISDVVFAADNTTVSVLWEGNSKDGVSGTVTLAVNGKTVYATKSTKVFCNHWVIPYNGAEYHVLVDVLPKKTILEETIYVWSPKPTSFAMVRSLLNFTTSSTGSRCLSLSATITASAWNRCLQHVSNPMVASR